MTIGFDAQNSPTAWFCMLQTAINKGDFTGAAKADKQLKRLGVTVKWRGNNTSGRVQAGGQLKGAQG